jgi:hypothetical protein
MPFRHVEDPRIREAMTRAYDLACARLKIHGSDPHSGKLATLIIQCGEREGDPTKLAALALAELEKITKRR